MASVLVRCPTIDPQFAGFKLEIRPSRIHRFGVFAGETIPANRKVIEYTGERVSRREAKRRGSGRHTYLFAVDNYWSLDGAVGGSGAEIINHSCDANLRATILKGHILYYSQRVLRRGEELLVDYRFSDRIGRIPCRCGAANCRGAINYKERG